MPRAINRYQQAQMIEGHERDALIAHAQALVRKGDYKAALPLLRRSLDLQSDPFIRDYARRVEAAARDQS